jgi:hypothetical protein
LQELALGSPVYGFYSPYRDDVFDLMLPAPKREPKSSGILHSGLSGSDPCTAAHEAGGKAIFETSASAAMSSPLRTL